MAKIETPVEGYNGPGPGGVEFKDGVGETDDPAAISYYQSAGYKVSGRTINKAEEVEVPDPRDYDDVTVGTRLRDAAVDPRPEDFLAPVNAGEENPHGPLVVSPSIHAVGPAPIRPGEVYVDDVDKQEQAEKDLAKQVLIDGEPATAVATDEGPSGPLELSDPGSVRMGVAAAKEVAASESQEVKEARAEQATKTSAVKKTAAKKSARRS